MTIEFDQEVEIDPSLPAQEIVEEVILGALDFAGFPYEAEVSVLVTDNEGIRTINRENRDIDKETDVLLFPMMEYRTPGDFSVWDEDDLCFNPDTGEAMLGDIVLSADKIREQAESYGHSLKRELAFLVAHSMFHLFGYDHMEEADRLLMEEKQRELLSRLGIER